MSQSISRPNNQTFDSQLDKQQINLAYTACDRKNRNIINGVNISMNQIPSFPLPSPRSLAIGYWKIIRSRMFLLWNDQ